MAQTMHRIFPLGQEQACLDYIALANTHAQTPANQGGVGMPWPFCQLVIDKHGQSTTQVLGAPVEYPVGTPLVETAELQAIAINSILAERPEMPPEE